MISKQIPLKITSTPSTITRVTTSKTSTSKLSTVTSTKENKPLSNTTTKNTISEIAFGKTTKKDAPEEEKKEVMKGLFTEMPTAKLRNIKTSDPFAQKTSLKT
jgi:hypothetical protein